MRFIESVYQKLRRHPKRIVFPEGSEPRVLARLRATQAAARRRVLLGSRAEIEACALEQKVSLDHVAIIDPATSSSCRSSASAWKS